MVVFIEGIVICRFKVKSLNKVDVLSGKDNLVDFVRNVPNCLLL